jgi:hypothetical protein
MSIPDLVAEILARAVEEPQRRQLTTAFLHREAVLTRVRVRSCRDRQCERQAIAQQRSLLRENRSRSRHTTETTKNLSTFSFSHGHHFARKPTA